jgi:HEAT repeat protein
MIQQRRIAIALLVVLAITGTANFGRAQGASKDDAEQKLIALLQSEASLDEKAKACQQLAVVGTKEAVPVLAALLDDEVLSDYARFGMEPIEDPSVDEALCEAMGKLKGRLLAGVVNSIGVRRDAKAVSGLQKLVRDPAAGVGSEALAALGQIATDEAMETIRQVLTSPPAALRPAAADAGLVGAERLLTQNRRGEALSAYDAIRNAEVPGQLRAAATYRAILVRGVAGLPSLMEQLRSDDPTLIGVALRAARELPGPEVSQALAAELDKTRPDVQALLIKVLADRKNPGALERIQTLATSDAPEVRLESLRALGGIGNTSSVAVLLKAAGAAEEEAAVARTSLRELESDGVDRAILAGMQSASDELRTDLIGILADRRYAAATPTLLVEAASEDEAVARAALKALAQLARPEDLPALITLLTAVQTDKMRRHAENAVATVAGRIEDEHKRADAVLSALDSADQVSVHCSLLRVLGRIANDRARNALVDAAGADNTEIRDAAVRALAAWPDTRVADRLLVILQETNNDTHRTLALRGYVRMVGKMSGEPGEIVDRYAEAMAHAGRAEDKKLILSGLASVGHTDALSMAAASLQDEPLQAEAAMAMVQIAGQIAQNEPEAARLALEQVLETDVDQGIQEQARAVLRQVEELR